jgi:hypothetical protein
MDIKGGVEEQSQYDAISCWIKNLGFKKRNTLLIRSSL